MSYHKYQIIYHNEEFMRSIREDILKNLFKKYECFKFQLKEIVNHRKLMKSHFELLFNALRSDANDMRRKNLKQFDLIIEQSVDNLRILRFYREELDWLSKRIKISDQESLKIWWKIANHATTFHNTFQEMISFFVKVCKSYIEIAQKYQQTVK